MKQMYCCSCHQDKMQRCTNINFPQDPIEKFLVTEGSFNTYFLKDQFLK